MEVNFIKFLLKVIAITITVLFVLMISFAQIMENSKFYEFISGYATSLFIFFLSILALYFSQERSLTIFLGMVMGGMFFRLIVFGAIVYFIYKYATLDIHYFIGSFVIFYLIFQFYEIKLIQQTLLKSKR